MQANIDGLNLAFSDEGEGLPIVLLHGHPFNRSMWRGQVDFLQENYRVICPDLRGYGETPVVSDVSKMSEMANDVMGLLDYLKLEKIILAGLSMGGYVALEFYNLYPEKLRALVLADTKAAADTEEARQKRSVSAEKVVREGMQSIVDDMLPKVFAPITSEKQPEIVENVKQMMLSTTPEGTAAGLRGMAERNDHTALLEKIKVPTLIIVGEEDQLTPPEEAEKMHRIIRNSQLAGIANAGHLSPNEQTEEFNNALIKFLKTIEA